MPSSNKLFKRPSISKDECKKLRDKLNGLRTVRQVAKELELDFSYSTLRKHAYGRCGHDHSVKSGTKPPNYGEPYSERGK